MAWVENSRLSMTGLDNSFTENTFGDLSYTFLEPVPNYLTCIICYGLLKDAVATECCGKMFCYEHSSRTERVCPACRHTPLAVARNKGIDSIVKDLKVFCLHREEGCQWSGHLCFEPDHRNSTCEYEVVSCTKGCGADMQRQHTVTHLLQDCPQREVKCEFCDVIVTAAELKSHQESCPDYPVGCPHGCELTLPRKKVEEHSTTCPELHVLCPFAGAGCNQRVKNKDLAVHISSSVVEHLLLISAENVSLREELQTLKKDHAAMKLEKIDMQTELKLMKEKCVELEHSVVQLKQSTELSWCRHLACQSASTPDRRLPMIFKYAKFQRHFDEGRDCYSPTFYTCNEGYHICLRMCPNGLEPKFSGYLSVTVLVLPGSYDDLLKWPIEGSLNITILNQLGDHSHFSKIFEFVRLPRKHRKRPKQDPVKDNEIGWGIARFIDHRSLFAKTDSCHYVVGGAIYIRVTSEDLE